RPAEDRPFVEWVCQFSLFEAQQALLGFFENLPVRPAGWALRRLVFPFGARFRPPSDELGTKVARALLGSSETLDRLTPFVHRPDAEEPGLGVLLAALESVERASEVTAKVKRATGDGNLPKRPKHDLYERAVEAKVITEEELEIVQQAGRDRDRAIRVDAFPSEAAATLSS
ncbi:MAG: acyl-CoA dehydrogenase domain-containing protein, partial [Planctomycetota bacterium]